MRLIGIIDQKNGSIDVYCARNCIRRDLLTGFSPGTYLYSERKANVIISAHGNSMRPFRRYFEDLTIDEMMKLENPHDRCSDYVVEF